VVLVGIGSAIELVILYKLSDGSSLPKSIEFLSLIIVRTIELKSLFCKISTEL
jgi:hypothetical protein